MGGADGEKESHERGGEGCLYGRCEIDGGKSNKGEKRHIVSGSTHGPTDQMLLLTHQKALPATVFYFLLDLDNTDPSCFLLDCLVWMSWS